jgi:CheY-like chemotaxis protein
MTTGLHSCLVIDDNVVQWVLAQKKLNAIPTLVCEYAENGDQGIGMCTKKEYDVVVVDYQMPGKNGSQTAKEIRQISPRSYLIGCSDFPNVVQLWNGDVQEVINKNWSSVATRVGEVIRK